MKTAEQMMAELNATRAALGLVPVTRPNSGYCHSGRDGDCNDGECPQLRDGEPEKTGRHCPLDMHDDERGYQ
ncbi:hypothetical protein GobsT_30790 [Gemmata obscuriglobus]|uniref:hypothetical protein n=1 Tax=Gemmata obscuriglobus TaxID=114 RepID=UPI00016C578A|nr:hypothetical protein [Gemmata obscuriglobus]QEG28302.1 hypothetical protein GobsT_30790 [Gemmata obscuriglobus]VTS06139.1 Uncharacterized protein OS=Yersinia enterocolitica (type O:5) str. YE53/03 GN=YE5303_00281 PE=4 SV=1 [Gemmata obscuriglobus UQM 2246]VTS08177.1 Uncharacterized protein OS=Yersinia enterocolitica (type O:5) str. YE53/03 GN=YE5303_00281 PE=4 SV=1 [Gemmata obscuriglobus UQM 2246]